MHLVVIHYHWRPGGVRQVVETLLPALRAEPAFGFSRVTLVSGEPPPDDWRHVLPDVHWVTEPAFGYVSENPAATTWDRVRTASMALLRGADERTLVLLENAAVGRNAALAPAVAEACRSTGAWLFCHHHDFFFDARWDRWPEFAAAGIATFDEAWAAAFPAGERIRHGVVSAVDSRALGLPHWPNPVEPRGAVEPATMWLRARLRTDAPVWLLPCRLLRRKNVAEAVLAARVLAPEAVVATTGGASSAQEAPYAAAIAELPGLHTGLAAERGSPSVFALMAAAERVVVPSLFEGFGLPAREACGLGRPVLVRRAALAGVDVPGAHVYDDLVVPWDLLDREAELGRQRALWTEFRRKIPADVPVGDPFDRLGADTVAFSRLTLTGQLRVLSHPAVVLGEAARLYNPWLAKMAAPEQKSRGSAEPARAGLTPALVDAWQTSGPPPAPTRPDASRLALTHHHPILWHLRT